MNARHPSLRKRLLIILMLASAATWLVAAISSYIDSRGEIENLFDAELAQIAKVLLVLSQHELYEELLHRGSIESAMPLDIDADELTLHKYEKKLAFQVWFDGDKMALRSANAPQLMLSQQTQGYSVTKLKGLQWRVFSLSDSDSNLTVQVAVLYNRVHGLAGQIAMRVLILIIAALVAVGVLTWFGIGKALRPLHRIADQVTKRNSFDLAPIQERLVPKETLPLIDALNSLLKRLETTLHNERCFTSNAAHELRTPLAGIAAHNEVAILADTQEMRISAAQHVKDGIGHMARLMQQLLVLARVDLPAEAARFKLLDLRNLSYSIIQECRHSAEIKNIDMGLQYQGQNSMLGIESAIEVLMRNLLDNAIRYTPQRGIVRFTITCLSERMTLRIMDSGPGIPEEEKLAVFQRFYRGDNDDKNGSGLGLSIVQRCVELHQGEITISKSMLGGLQLEVRIPCKQ